MQKEFQDKIIQTLNQLATDEQAVIAAKSALDQAKQAVHTASRSLLNLISEEQSIPYPPESINWYRSVASRAMELSKELRSITTDFPWLEETLAARAKLLDCHISAWVQKYCDFSIEIDPDDTRRGDRDVAEQIDDYLDDQGNGDIRKVWMLLQAFPDSWSEVLQKLTPDDPIAAVAAYIVRNNWKKKHVGTGLWQDQHHPTDSDKLFYAANYPDDHSSWSTGDE